MTKGDRLVCFEFVCLMSLQLFHGLCRTSIVMLCWHNLVTKYCDDEDNGDGQTNGHALPFRLRERTTYLRLCNGTVHLFAPLHCLSFSTFVHVVSVAPRSPYCRWAVLLVSASQCIPHPAAVSGCRPPLFLVHNVVGCQPLDFLFGLVAWLRTTIITMISSCC